MSELLPQVEEEIENFSSISDIPLYICSLSNDGKNFIVYNVEKNRICLKIPNPAPFEVKVKGCIYKLNGSQLFYYGGLTKNYEKLGHCFLIDIKTQTIEILSSGRPRYNATPIYFENFIYVFGGCTGIGTKGGQSSDKYSIRKNKWKNIADLPEITGQTCTVVFERKILIAGLWAKFIYKYDPEENSYEELLEIEKNTWKLFFLMKNRCYVVTSGLKWYSSEVSDYKNWSYLGEIQGLRWLYSNICYYNKSFIYFDEICEVSKFDFRNLRMKSIARTSIS